MSLTNDGHPNIPVSRVSNRFIGRQVATSWNIVRIEAEKVRGTRVCMCNYIIFFFSVIMGKFLFLVLYGETMIGYDWILKRCYDFF